MPKSKVYIFKASLISLALLIESFFLSNVLFEFVQTQNYFSPDVQQMVVIGVLLLLILWTYSLSVGGWRKWEQYVIAPLPIALGIFLVLAQFDVRSAGVVAVVAYVLIAYQVYIASGLRKDFVRFRPDIIFGLSTKGVLFLFSFVTGALVFLNASLGGQEIDLGRKVGEFADTHSESLLPQDLPLPGLNVTRLVESEFNKLVAPYRDFIPPLMALIAFTLVGFVGAISRLAFMYTVRPLFALSKRIGFLQINQVSVEKEEIVFESAKE